jgi:hypothetical protein
MANLACAFDLQINSENRDFVVYPYTPFQRLMSHKEGKVMVDPRLLTIPRYFDIKHGAKDCFSPSFDVRVSEILKK